MSELKTKKNDGSVKEFVNSIPDPLRRSDCEKLLALMHDVTDETPSMWGSSMVGYGTYDYTYATGRQGTWFKFGFSPRKQNLTLYFMTGFDDYAKASKYDPQPLLNKLGKHSTGKSCLYIKSLDDIDISVLQKLIKSSYEAVSNA